MAVFFATIHIEAEAESEQEIRMLLISALEKLEEGNDKVEIVTTAISDINEVE